MYIYLVFHFLFSIHFVKRTGAVLEAGSILARLELDDLSQMKRVRFKLKFYFLKNSYW